MDHVLPLLLIVTMGGFLSGCQTGGTPAPKAPYQTVADSPGAKASDEKGLKLLQEGKLAEAEQAFKDALSADSNFGPAHNNLGRVYYEQGKLYLAAWEFQYAAKVMPGRPEPLNNIGMVYEAAAKWNDAVDSYAKAVAIAPDNPEYIGNLARTKSRRGDKDQDLADLLHKIIDHDTRPDWVTWARETLMQLHPAK